MSFPGDTYRTGGRPRKERAALAAKGPLAAWRRRFLRRDGIFLNLLFSICVPIVTLLCMEWVARGTLGPHEQGNGFFQAMQAHYPAFFLAFVMLLAVYVMVSQLSGSHLLATVLLGIVGIVPAAVTHFKLTMRGEPFLPWDITQIGDLMGVSGSLTLEVPANLYISGGIFLLLSAGAFFVRLPRDVEGKPDWMVRLIAAGTALVCFLGLLFAVFLSPSGTAAMGIKEDMWMQDRYYRNNGVITGFLTNLQMLDISEPGDYSAEAVRALAAETEAGRTGTPLFPASFAAGGTAVERPNIIYLMAESFWDVTALDGIAYDQPILPNFSRLSRQSAHGQVYTPSFGGGTCDVEFEALTGFSMEYLPAGSKPYQQYVTRETFALPWVLKHQGYQTLAVHGYGGQFWNRETAYPRLGIDEFISSEDFVDPDRKRGFISDEAMVDRIIEEYEAREKEGPVFVHAVTMQNHTTYSRDRYPADQLVRVTEAPDTLPDSTIGQLEDCATGIRDMDAALGRLCNYFANEERPTIVVFWGDHMNPMNDGHALFEKTGFIAKGDVAAPQLYQTPLLVWSNFSTGEVELGTLSTYNISPVVMDLFGLEKPLYYEYLTQQIGVLRGRTRGVTLHSNGSFDEEMSAAERTAYERQAVLQYDYLFGKRLLEDYIPTEEEQWTQS